MPTIKLPQAGKAIQSATVRRWLKRLGDSVAKGDVLVELDTEEGLLQVEAPLLGKLGQILLTEGKTATLHSPLAIIEEVMSAATVSVTFDARQPESKAPAGSSAGTAASTDAKGAGSMPTGKVIPVLMPKAGQSMEEGTIVRWRVPVGATIKKGDVIFEIETDKATMEVEATDSGRLARIVVPEGGVLPVLQPVAYLADSDADVDAFIAAHGQGSETPQIAQISNDNNGPAEAGTHTQAGGSYPSDDSTATNRAAPSARSRQAVAPGAVVSPEGRVKASPAARKVAQQRGVDLRSVGAGSGPAGRILSSDVPAVGAPAGAPKRRRMSQMRKAVARNLLQSKQTIPHFYMRLTLNAEPMLAFYQAQKAQYPCSINDVIVMACGRVMAEFPAFRSRIDGDEIVESPTANIGIAVGMDDGLVVPVLIGAERMGLQAIGAETKRLAGAARGGKIEGMGQGCFTITNLGMFGTEEFAAIINPPEAAILAVGAAREAVVVKDGAMRAGKVMTVTLSADHRVVDGMLAAKFLARLKELLENPGELA